MTFDYMEESALTASTQYHGTRVPLIHLSEVLHECAEALNKLDRIKKCLFYGRELGPITEGLHYGEVFQNCESLPIWISEHPSKDKKAKDIIHGIIGKATEAGELLEALIKVIDEGQELDLPNVGEEIGDGLWYDAMLLRAIDSNFGEVQAINIAKLRQRFPNRFTEYDANNRNLAQEREILEQIEK